MLTLKRLNMESPAPVRRGLAVHFTWLDKIFDRVETELLSGDYSMWSNQSYSHGQAWRNWASNEYRMGL